MKGDHRITDAVRSPGRRFGRARELDPVDEDRSPALYARQAGRRRTARGARGAAPAGCYSEHQRCEARDQKIRTHHDSLSVGWTPRREQQVVSLAAFAHISGELESA